MSHDTDPTPVPPAGPNPDPAHQPPEAELPPVEPLPGADDEFGLPVFDDIELADLSDDELAEALPGDGGAVSFDMPDVPIPESEHAERTLGVRLEDLAGLPELSGLLHAHQAPEVQPLLGVEQVSPLAEVPAPAAEIVPPAEPESMDDYVPYSEELPEALPASDTDLFFEEIPLDLADAPAAAAVPGEGGDVPFVVEDPDAALGNLEPLAPVAPASGWFDPPSGDPAAAAIPIEEDESPFAEGRARERGDDLAARIEAEPAGYGESSDIFAGGPIPQATADFSDVIAATANAPAEPASDPDAPRPPVRPGTNRPSDVALSFDLPPGGSTINDPAAAADLPVADELPSGSGLLFSHDSGRGPFDSDRLADAAELLSDRTEEADLGGTPIAGHDASSILSDLEGGGATQAEDSSSIQLQAPGMDATVADESPAEFEAAGPFELTVADEPPPTSDSGEPTDWRVQSGSDLFADARTAPEIRLPDDSGQVNPFGDGATDEQPSLSSAPSSIFSADKIPAVGSGSGSDIAVGDAGEIEFDELEFADPEVADAVEFSDHPDPDLADSSTLHIPVVGSQDSDINLSSSGEQARDPSADSGRIDWSSADDLVIDASSASGPMSGILGRGPDPENPTDDLPIPGVAPPQPGKKKPAARDPNDSSVVVDWVSPGSSEEQKLPAAKSRPTPSHNRDDDRGRPRTDTDATRMERAEKPAGVSGRAAAGLALGLLIGVGASAGVYFSGLLSSGDANKTAGPGGNPNAKGNGGDPGTQIAALTVADARAALDAGDPARALKAIEAAGATTPEAKAARGEAKFFTRLREAAAANAPIAADDAKLAEARADLKAVAADADAAKTPEGEKAAVRATLHLGLTHELAGDRAAAKQLYEDAAKKFPKAADVFQAALDRLAATAPADGKVMRLTPREAEQLALAVVVMVALHEPPPPAPPAVEEPGEAGPMFWKAVNAAAAGKYADAVKQVTGAKAAHEKRAKALAGRGLNPLSDPLEQIFPRCCDDLKAYWELKKTLYEHPGIGALVKKDGVEKALDQLAGAEKRAADAVKVAAELKTAKETLAAREVQLAGEMEKVKTAEKAITAEKDKVAKLAKDYKLLEITASDLDKSGKAAQKTIDGLQDQIVGLATQKKRQDAVLDDIAKTLQSAKLLPEKYDADAIIAATRSAASRATGPDLSKLVPPALAAVVGNGLTTAQLLDLADRVNKFDADARAAEAKLASATADFKKQTEKLTTENAAAVKKIKDAAAAEAKKLTDQFAADLKKANDTNAADMKKLADKYAADLKKLDTDHDAAMKKQADTYEAKVKTLQDEVLVERDRVEAAVKKARTDLANALTPAQALDMWLPLLTSLRRPADAAPAILAADKVLKAYAADSEDAAKAQTVTGVALLIKGDTAGAKVAFTAAKNSPAYKLSAGKDWVKTVEVGLASLDDPAAPFRRTVEGPRKDKDAAARFLDAGITAYKAGRYADAVKALADAAGNDDTDPLAWYFLGAARWELGEATRAVADFRQGGEREKARTLPVRAVDGAISPIQGAARDALNKARP